MDSLITFDSPYSSKCIASIALTLILDFGNHFFLTPVDIWSCISLHIYFCFFELFWWFAIRKIHLSQVNQLKLPLSEGSELIDSLFISLVNICIVVLNGFEVGIKYPFPVNLLQLGLEFNAKIFLPFGKLIILTELVRKGVQQGEQEAA